MKVQDQSDELRLIAEEAFTLPQMGPLKQTMLESLNSSSASAVVLDLADVHEMDSSGIQLVIGLFKSCQLKNVSFAVESITPSVLKVFKLCKLNTMITIRGENGNE